MVLHDVKLLLGIEDDSRDDLLNLLISNAETQVLGRLDGLDLVPTVVPEPLAFIIPEVVVSRFNRIGSEGLSSHTVEGESSTYKDDDMLAYESTINRYLNSLRVPKGGVVRFL